MVNSIFLKRNFDKSWNTNSDIIYPLIPYEKFFALSETPLLIPSKIKYITFINPVPVKGLEIFLNIVSLLPEENFLVVGGWNEKDRVNFKKNLVLFKNITYIEPVDDIREVLNQTKILLFPSVWEESFGRIVIEASINGIPVLANNTGGIKETMGNSGIVLPFDKNNHLRYVELWVKKIKQLNEEPDYYSEKSKQAFIRAKEHNEISVKSLNDFLIKFGLLNK